MQENPENTAYFRIYNFTCSDPLAISELLQIEAHNFGLKGDYLSVGGGARVKARNNFWELKSPLAKEKDIREHVEWLLELLTPKKEELICIYTKYKATAGLTIVSYTYNDYNPGFYLEEELIRKLCELRAALDVDLYTL